MKRSHQDTAQDCDGTIVFTAIKYRNIAAKRYFDHDVATGALASEIVCKTSPEPGCLNANNWVNLRVEGFVTPESLNSDRIALDTLRLAAKRRLHDEAEKSDELWRPAERRTISNTPHRAANLL